MRLELHTVAVMVEGCFSVLKWDGRPFAVSIERTFHDGRPVILNGQYRCFRDFFHRGGYETFEIKVAGHERVLFHRGNVETESSGCILIGRSFGMLEGKPAVLDSRGGFAEFMRLSAGLEEFEMIVTGDLR